MLDNFYPEIASDNSLAWCLAHLITSFLHGDDPPGVLVRVGVAVVLEVGVVPLYHHTELASLRTPSKAVGEIEKFLFRFSDTDGKGGPGWPLQSMSVSEEHWKQERLW